MEIKSVISKLKTKVIPTWVKEHYEGEDDDQTEYNLNCLSHSDAVNHRRHPPPFLHCTALHHFLQSHIITAYHSGDMVTSQMPHLIQKIIHYQPLKDKSIKDKKWTGTTFAMVDWHAYHRALHHLPRCGRILVIKLSNHLWNTNLQNNKYYGISAVCPHCSTQKETFTHVFYCIAMPATVHQDHIFSGIHQWESSQAIQSPSQCSVTKIDTILTYAFTEQTTIDWKNFVKGHVSSAW
jgi:hypothetical protein